MNAKLTELADGVFAWVHDVQDRFTCNVGVLVEDDSLTLIDTSGRPSSFNALQEAIQFFDRPVTRIVLTHEHGDHVAGVQAFPEAELYSSGPCAKSLSSPPATPFLQKLHPGISQELAALSHPAPTSIVEDTTTIGRHGRIELLSGHSKGDLVCYVPDADTVFAGDLCFFGHVPLGIGADFSKWRDSIQQLKSSHVSRVVPGHGPIGGQLELDQVDSYLEAVLDAAATDSEVREGPWNSWWDPWNDRIAGAINRINVEQAVSPDEVPSTLIQLLSD